MLQPVKEGGVRRTAIGHMMIRVTEETGLRRLLDDAANAPALLDCDGESVRHRQEEEIAGEPDPAVVRRMLVATAGSWADVDLDRVIGELQEPRRTGTRSPHRPWCTRWTPTESSGRRATGGPPSALERPAGDRSSVSYSTAGKVYERAFTSANPQARLTSFRRFLSPYRLLGLGAPIMERCAKTGASFRVRGQCVAGIGLSVGATALHHDSTVLTFNPRDFQRIPDLKLYQPS